MNNATQHIVSDAGIAFGKPRIAGTRFTVRDVVILICLLQMCMLQ
jgi:uncharacterized protein (DUF433 family)